jgi:hypothetical protein
MRIARVGDGWVTMGRQRQKEVPAGLHARKAKAKCGGSLHCATDGETVRCFGRDDEFLVGGNYNCKKQVLFGDDKQEKQLQLRLQGFFAALRMTNVKVDAWRMWEWRLMWMNDD